MKKIPFIHILLFLLTLLSTLVVGALYAGEDLFSEPYKIYTGIPFAFSLMIILLSHEFSHYFASKKHGVQATLPYFIPAPPILSPIGTFGAFIKMKSPIITRKALIDIGASGPLMGFLMSIIVLVPGLNMSKVVSASQAKGPFSLGASFLFSSLSRMILGVTPADHGILLSPVAFAGWIGLFVTSINLIPVGQLDGGHIAYALLGEKQGRLSLLLVIVLAFLGVFVWEGWLVWAVLLFVLGLKHPPVIYWETPLDTKRTIAAWVSFVIFIITFIPVPFALL
jgi:membrane-associated protease RseP (regulator of RpoE activity)